jgi:hypothetical protein
MFGKRGTTVKLKLLLESPGDRILVKERAEYAVEKINERFGYDGFVLEHLNKQVVPRWLPIWVKAVTVQAEDTSWITGLQGTKSSTTKES